MKSMTKIKSALKVAFVHHCVVPLGLVACFTAASAQAEFGDLLHQLSASDGFIDDRFGLSVDISGTRALVGRAAVTVPPEPDVPGAVYLYDLTTGAFTLGANRGPGGDYNWRGFDLNSGTLLAGVELIVSASAVAGR